MVNQDYLNLTLSVKLYKDLSAVKLKITLINSQYLLILVELCYQEQQATLSAHTQKERISHLQYFHIEHLLFDSFKFICLICLCIGLSPLGNRRDIGWFPLKVKDLHPRLN